ncbi:MAG: sugar phosphate isomerase/epimerase [Phycisphaerae bacterium]|nr:sugar phosphate isomerase/epimerase [Phycisphaerae bacterium]
MTNPQLSVCLDDLCPDVKTAMARARSLGFSIADVSASRGIISPGELSWTGQRHLLRHLSDMGLRLGSLRGPVGGPGYADAVAGERRLDTMRSVIRLAAALEVRVVSTAPGPAADSADVAEAGRLREALTLLADDADRAGVVVAVETAGIGARTLNSLLTAGNCTFLSSCCDSGAMLMQGEDPHEIAEILPGRIQLVRARDAVRGSAEAAGYEVALGDGHLDTPRFLAALAEAGFYGDIVLSRTTGADPAGDLHHARQEFERTMA